MKVLKISCTILFIVTVILFTACGDGSSNSKTKDVPDYALGKTSYFAPRESKRAHAFLGFADARTGYEKFGLLDNGRNLSGDLVVIGGKNVMFLYASSNSYSKYIIEGDSAHIMHLLWFDQTPKNPYNTSLIGGSSIRNSSYNLIEGSYSDSYLFTKRKDVAEAIDYLNTLEKQPNQPSQYNPSEHGGTKTYKAKVGKQVLYIGNDSLNVKKFQSLYLDCGAVVEHYPRNIRANYVGDVIDCVTDDNNKVLIYEFYKD